VSQGDSAFEAFQKLRTSVWSREGWEKVPIGQYEIDVFDLTAVCIVVLHNEQLVGGYRLIMADEIELLPFSKHCQGAPPTTGPAVEISRWCIDQKISSKIRGVAHRIMMKGAFMYLSSQAVSHRHVYIDVCDFLFEHCLKIGMNISQLGKKHRRPDGSAFIPAVVDMYASAVSGV
jgi:N-acyl-L-homoserine lactone synthetase